MRPDLRYLFASVAATAAFTFLALAFPNMSRFLTAPGAVACFILTVYFLWPEIRDFHKNRQKRVIALIGMIVCAIGLAGFSAFYFWTTPELKTDVPKIEFSWNWDPLTDAEFEKIYLALKDKPKQTIQTALNPRTAGNLGDSFDELFKKLGWTYVGAARRGAIFADGITGLVLNKSDETSNLVKDAIEKNTGLRIAIGGIINHMPPGEHPTLFIGAKPTPQPLPPGLKAQVVTLGGNIKKLSLDVARFYSDRKQAESLLPARNTYPMTPEGNGTWWARKQSFRTDTQAAFQERFGSQAAMYLNQLSDIGIEPAFSVTSDSAMLGKWFGTVGELLEGEHIEQARTTAANTRFWMGQLN